LSVFRKSIEMRPCRQIRKMFAAKSVPWAVLFVYTAWAQPSQLSYADAGVCCLAPDGHGNSFVVSSWYPNINLRDTMISVAKLDSTGEVVSTFRFETGNGEVAAAAAVDPSGNLWIVGTSTAATPNNAPTVGLILKMDQTGTKLLSTATFGGLDTTTVTQIQALAFDITGHLYVAGHTAQLDFPLTQGAFISKFPTLPPPPGSPLIPHAGFGFLAKFAQSSQATPPYTLVYSTLLGGLGLPATGGFPPLPATNISALAVDSSGIATVAGISTASDFPVTPNAYQTQFEGNFTPNVFVTQFNSEGSGLVWSTFLGVGDLNRPVGGLALDAAGNVIVAGVASQPDFPITAGSVQSQFHLSYDTFVAKLDPDGSRLAFSTFYGAVNGSPSAPRLDEQGNVWITESVTDVASVALGPNSLALGTAVISEIASDGSHVIFSELLPNGMAGQGLVLNPDTSLTVAGANGFLLRQPRATPPAVSVLGVADSAASAVTKSVAPGEFLSIYGTGLGPAAGVGMEIDQNGRVASSLAGTQVTIGGVPAPLLYVSENQINVLVPYEAASGGSVNLQITSAAGSSQTVPFDVLQAQPNIFTVLNADGSLNSESNPAQIGSTVSAFVSGAGVLNAPLTDGTIASSPASAPALPVGVVLSYGAGGFFGGFGVQTVMPTYAGGIPGTVVNLLRVDFPAADLPCSVCRLAVQLGAAPSPTGTSYGAVSPTAPLYLASPSH
jgi:uncharacterized protein (TIGR03437 family)